MQAPREPDQEKRDEIIGQVWQFALFDNVSYIPLHQQTLASGRVEKSACRPP
jgi:peptide/nickel transport system substrate-binding protein